MIDINEARQLMPSNRRDSILDEVEKIIVEAAQNDNTIARIPKGFFGKGIEEDVIYNARQPPLYKYVKEELEKRGFKLGRNTQELYFVVSWEN